MLEKLVEAPVCSEDPWCDDKLGRQEVAAQLTHILATATGPLVVSVSAPFGMGKTFFAKRWVADLRRQSKPAIYLNAWESDYSENPLLAFMHSLRAGLSDHLLDKDKKTAVVERIEEVTKVAAPALAKTAARAALRAGAFVLVGDKVDELVEAAAKGAIDEVEKFAEAQVEVFAKECESRAKFRGELERLRKEITDDNIYIVVDELDRCRPDYAVEFLEAIKHLFDVEGFVFVLVAYDEQLRNTASRLFGPRAPGESYSDKFIDYKFNLPPPSPQQAAQFLYDAYRLEEVMPPDERDTCWGKCGILESFVLFAQRFGLSLRTQIRCFSIINLVTRLYGVQIAPALCALVCLREGRPDTWREVVEGSRKFSELGKILGYNEKADKETDYVGWYYDHFLRIFYTDKPFDDGGENLRFKLNLFDERQRVEMVQELVERIEAIEKLVVR